MDLRPQPESLTDDRTPAPSLKGGDVGTGRRDTGRELADLELLDEHALRRLVTSQPVIEQAKGLLMGHYRINADQAFEVLSDWSSRGGLKVRDLAAQLVRAAATPGSRPFDPLHELAGSDGHTEPAGNVATRDA